jgi:hypothetical protein
MTAPSLRERAAQAANGREASASEIPERPTIINEPLPDIDYSSNPTIDAEQVPVHTAWARVMADVQSISKGDKRNDVGGRYDFRGVDRVVNAVGPALRHHGVLVLPTKILNVEYRETRTSKGNPMQECVVTVQWTVRGPKGDDLPPLESVGQATDTQDKATAKAVSVAQRVLFLSSLQIPTQDPDIDRGHERGERPVPKASAYVEEVCDPRTSLARLRQIHGELATHRLLGVSVVNEVGDDEPIGTLVTRIGQERKAAGGAS